MNENELLIIVFKCFFFCKMTESCMHFRKCPRDTKKKTATYKYFKFNVYVQLAKTPFGWFQKTNMY